MSQPVSRAIALTILFVVLWLGWFGLALPFLLDTMAIGEANARAAQVLARYRMLAADLPALRKDLEAVAKAADGEAFLPPASPAMTSAGLQDNVQRLVVNAGATLHTTRTLPAGQDDGFQKFGLELDVSADLTTLRHLLVALETARPFIRIERLAIQIPENAAVPFGADGQPDYGLHLQLTSFAQSPSAARQ